MSNHSNSELATFAGGCFWCLEAVFARLKGVEKVSSGYIGGTLSNPTYREVCSGLTGHAEAIQIQFNPDVVNFEVLLKVFFSMHNPTTLNRQGGDIGTQYRSGIFYHNEEQAKMAKEMILTLEKEQIYSDKIVTEICPATEFYIAEDYHHKYYDLNKESNSYCSVVIDPKINKLRKSFAHLLS